MSTRAPLPLTTPEPHGFLYVGVHADGTQKGPVCRWTTRRRQAATRLTQTAAALLRDPAVHSVRVFRTVLVPPLPGAPRHDLALLVRTASVEDLERVRSSEALRSLPGREILVGRNAARIGETEADREATFLFNHFTAPGGVDPVRIWTGLTDWYTSTIGVDNSTALSPVEDDAEFQIVNYVRLPAGPLRLLLGQLLRPSFHRVVRGTLERSGMRSLPCFYRMLE